MTRPRTALRRGKILPRLYNFSARREKWIQHTGREATDVVKGMNRRVIVVRSPDPQMFEEAIFILREDYLRQRNEAQVLDEARRAAGEYLKTRTPSKKKGRTALWLAAVPVLLALGAGAAYIALRYLL